MKIALYHGYELSGSGSNEYTRYLARTLAAAGHELVLICSEPDPQAFDFIARAVAYDVEGNPRQLFARPGLPVTLHRLPRTSVYPVYVTDKQRPGTVKAFPELTDAELHEYESVMTRVVTRVLVDERPDVLQANHLVYQPVVAAAACRATDVPFYVVPHGSSIEYAIRRDPRLLAAARAALAATDGVVWIGREVRDRVLALYPDLRAEIESKSHMVGIGTDTTLFRPLAPGERRDALHRLRAMHRPGGKTAAQRQALLDGLERLDIERTRADWDTYDHHLEDDDLPAILDSIPDDGELVGFVGALTYGKGVQSLIAAMPGILARRPAAHLVLVGSGTYREVLEGLVYALETANAELFDRLVAAGQDLERATLEGPLEDLAAYAAIEPNRRLLRHQGPRLAGRIHFLGRLDHERLRLILPCWRLAVFPSIVKEASPLVFAEALSAGVLPMGAYHSGLRDGLDDLRDDLPERFWRRMRIAVEPAERIPSIVDHVSTLLELLATTEMGGRLRQIAEERYDWPAVAGTMIEVAEQVRGRCRA